MTGYLIFTFFPYVQGQTAYDVADSEMFRLLEELKKKQVTAQKDRGDINSILQKKGASTPKRRSVLIVNISVLIKDVS
jgi:hypothetical protein